MKKTLALLIAITIVSLILTVFIANKSTKPTEQAVTTGITTEQAITTETTTEQSITTDSTITTEPAITTPTSI